MVKITDPDLNAVVENFEAIIEALDRYRETLVARRQRYESEARDPAGYERVIAMNLRRIERLEAHLDGETYDLLRDVLDGSGTLASVDEGRWI